MDVQAVSALLAALLILAIGVSVLLRSRTDRMYTSFAAFTFTVSAWHLCTFIDAATESPVMRWLALWAAATIPPTAIRFFRIFLAAAVDRRAQARPARHARLDARSRTRALVYSAIVAADPRRRSTSWSRSASTCSAGSTAASGTCTMQYRATDKRVERTRVGYLALGGFVATTLTLTDVLPRFGVAWPAVGNVLGILYLYFLSQTLFRYRLIDLNELLGKMAVLGTLVVLLWAVYGFLLYWIGGGQKGLYLLNALVASFVILILFEPVRSWLENGINRWLLRQRTELRGRLDAVRRELPGVVDVPDMVAADHDRARGVAPRDRRGGLPARRRRRRLRPRGLHRPRPPPERLDANAERALLDRVRGGYLEHGAARARARRARRSARRRGQARAAASRSRTALEELGADLVFPLLGSAETEQGPWLLGLFCLRDERTESAFDADDIDVFRQLAIGAARVIESSQAYERVKERDRLAALGEMAAGLAHEIRNPLGAIKGAAQLLIDRRRHAAPQPRAPRPPSSSQIIVEEANRLNNVVTRFLDYARPERPGREGADKVDLNAVVRKTVQLLQQEPLQERRAARARSTISCRRSPAIPSRCSRCS